MLIFCTFELQDLVVYSLYESHFPFLLTLSQIMNTIHIDSYCESYLTRNIWFSEEFARILKIKLTKGTIAEANPITTLFARVKPKMTNISTLRSHLPDLSVMEALLSDFPRRYSELEFLETNGMVTDDMFKLLNILYYKLRHAERKTVLEILNYLFSMRTLSLDDIVYPEVAHVRFAKNDLVWYLWKILLIYASKQKNTDVKAFVKSNLDIFATTYQKKSRNRRIDILYHVFINLCKKEELYSKCLIKPIVQQVEPELALEEDDNDHDDDEFDGQSIKSNQTKTSNKSIKTKQSKQSKQSKQNNPDSNQYQPIQFDYLKVFTYLPSVSTIDNNPEEKSKLYKDIQHDSYKSDVANGREQNRSAASPIINPQGNGKQVCLVPDQVCDRVLHV